MNTFQAKQALDSFENRLSPFPARGPKDRLTWVDPTRRLEPQLYPQGHHLAYTDIHAIPGVQEGLCETHSGILPRNYEARNTGVAAGLKRIELIRNSRRQELEAVHSLLREIGRPHLDPHQLIDVDDVHPDWGLSQLAQVDVHQLKAKLAAWPHLQLSPYCVNENSEALATALELRHPRNAIESRIANHKGLLGILHKLGVRVAETHFFQTEEAAHTAYQKIQEAVFIKPAEGAAGGNQGVCHSPIELDHFLEENTLILNRFGFVIQPVIPAIASPGVCFKVGQTRSADRKIGASNQVLSKGNDSDEIATQHEYNEGPYDIDELPGLDRDIGIICDVLRLLGYADAVVAMDLRVFHAADGGLDYRIIELNARESAQLPGLVHAHNTVWQYYERTGLLIPTPQWRTVSEKVDANSSLNDFLHQWPLFDPSTRHGFIPAAHEPGGKAHGVWLY